MMVDCVNKDDNDVTAGDIITACQPAKQKRALPGRRSRLGRTKKREKEGGEERLVHPFGFQFNSASLFSYSNFSCEYL